MKVGDAGEAFFVFETDEDVPQDLITSPILQATQPGQKNQDIEAGRFGTKEGSDEEEDEEGVSYTIQRFQGSSRTCLRNQNR